MTQEEFDRILGFLINPEDIYAFKKLWKRYNQYEGAAVFGKTPEIHVHYDEAKKLGENI